MIIPLFIMLLLVSLINRAAKKFQVSSSIPMAVSAGLFLVFAILSRGMIKVRSESELAGALVLALVMYAAVAAVIYGAAYAYIKQAWRKKQETPIKRTSNKTGKEKVCRRCGVTLQVDVELDRKHEQGYLVSKTEFDAAGVKCAECGKNFCAKCMEKKAGRHPSSGGLACLSCGGRMTHFKG